MKTDPNRIFEEICNIPLYDAHTHIDSSHLAARHIGDVSMYHMVGSELYVAGAKNGARLSENPTDAEVESRMLDAVHFYKDTYNTSCSWMLRILLKDLYDWDEPITESNWHKLDQIIRDKAADPNRGREIMAKGNIKKITTEYTRMGDGSNDDILVYSLEWAFFTRNQWQQFDTALLELEHAWSQGKPGLPLPVTTNRAELNLSKTIKTVDDVKEAISFYCEVFPYDKVVSTASHLSTDITYRLVTDDEMAKAIANRANAGVWERDVYANYITEAFFTELENRRKNDLILQFSIGAEPLPFEMGSKLNSNTVFELASMFNRHKDLQFNLFLSSQHQNQAICTLCRELPNLSVSGYWWFNFFPSIIKQVCAERLDMLPLSKNVGYFTDAYCVEWAYAKSIMIRKIVAQVLAEKIDMGQYTETQAIDIATAMFNGTAQKLFKTKM